MSNKPFLEYSQNIIESEKISLLIHKMSKLIWADLTLSFLK